MHGIHIPSYEVSKQYPMRVTKPPNPGCFQNPCAAQLQQNFLLVILSCLPLIIWLDATHKMRLAHHHFR